MNGAFASIGGQVDGYEYGMMNGNGTGSGAGNGGYYAQHYNPYAGGVYPSTGAMNGHTQGRSRHHQQQHQQQQHTQRQGGQAVYYNQQQQMGWQGQGQGQVYVGEGYYEGGGGYEYQ